MFKINKSWANVKNILKEQRNKFLWKKKRRTNHGIENYRTHRTYWTYGLSDQTFKFTGNAQRSICLPWTDYAYLAFVDNSTLEDAVKGLRALKMVGSNVFMPNKTVVGQYLDKLSPAAELCGAVNTIVNEDGVLTGHITDGIGFMQSLKDKTSM